MKKRSGILLMLLAIFLTFGVAVQAYGGPTLIVATTLDDVITLDPGWAGESTNLTIHHATYDTLLEIHADDLNKVVPGLAESWEVSDDGLVYTFKLREGVKFASGNPVTAEDVRFSWTRLKNLKGNPAFYTDPIATVEAVDELTVKATLTVPYPAFPTVVTAPAMSVLDSLVVKEHGGTDAADADATDTAKEWLDQNSAGSGPFILTGWTPDSEITMVCNDNYWRGGPALGAITLKDVNDASTALQQLERGDVDIVQNIDADNALLVKDNPNLKMNIGQSLNVFYMAMSPSDFFEVPLSDVRVRQAIAYSIDYDGIINDLLQGYADRPASMLPVGIQGSDPSKRYTRDLDKAKALLAEAGYADGFDLTLYIGEGVTVGIPRETFAAKIQADLAEVGINLTINQQTTTNFLTAFRAQELPFVLSTWTPDYLDATMWSDYFSYPDNSVAKRVRMDSPKIADLALRAGNERDPETRTQLYSEYQAAHVEEAIFIPLVQQQYIDVLGPGIEGYVFHPVYFIEFYGITKSS